MMKKNPPASSRPVCGAFIAWRKPIAAAAAAIFRCTLNARTCIVHPQTENRHQIPIRAPLSVAAMLQQTQTVGHGSDPTTG